MEVAEDQVEPSLGAIFAQVCQQHRDRTAVTHGDHSVSYAEVDMMAERIAAALLDRGAGPGTIVAICLERSIEMIAAVLAVVKTGAAYLPIDASCPAVRVAETIDDARPIVVISAPEIASRFGAIAAGWMTVSEPAPHTLPSPVRVSVREDAPAYVIYTSGSTGTPKGVVVSHRNVIRLLRETQKLFAFSVADVWTMSHSFAFDFSVWEFWGCLLSGGRLVIVPSAVTRAPGEFRRLLVREQVTVLNQTPSAFALLEYADARSDSNGLALRLVILGGEALAPASLRVWFERHGDAHPHIVNMYGITETTVHTTWRRMRQRDVKDRESLIGEPLGDVQLYLLDDQMRPVPDGDQGELWVGGGGVASGYLNRGRLTGECFRANPFGQPGDRLYRSGDRGRRRADGELVYLGRRDEQVKVNGFRVETGEVEALLTQHPAVAQACVVAHASAGEATRLAAYFVVKPGHAVESIELRSFLAERLPSHFIPALCRRLTALPLTGNGKVNRGALTAALAEVPDSKPPVAWESSIESKVAAVWSTVLKGRDFTFEDDFFDVGGASLLLNSVRTRLQEQLHREIPAAWIFEHTTVQSLARRLTEPEAAVALAQVAGPLTLQHLGPGSLPLRATVSS